MPEWNTTGELKTAVLEPEEAVAAPASEQPEAPAAADSAGSQAAEAQATEAQATEAQAAEPGETSKTEEGLVVASADLMADIATAIRQLADSAGRYHDRAQQRESVIDHLSAEVDRLRRGERRGLLRPLLVEICRLRNDLLRQAGELPTDFDTERAARLLRSYADSVELTLENNGVVSFAPDSGDAFDPRMHRRVGGEPTQDPAFAGRVARVRRDGYLDVDANSPIAPAEVVVFATADPQPYQDKREEQ